MSLLLILVILVLGYLYMESTPAEKARLGLSNGWVTYVLLGQHGLYFFIQGLVGYLLIWAILGVALLALHGLLLLGGAGLPWAWLGSLFWGEFALVLHLAIIALLAYVYCQEEIKKRQKDDWSKDLEELKKLNALLQFAVNALKQGRLVKISLKSRKVYMGIIAGEHFEHNDLEHITLIPYFSGHRDKDTLRLQLSRSYLDSYRQLDLIPRPEDSPEQRQQRLEELNHFRLLIRLGEVESLSFFHEALLADHIAPARLDSTPPTES